MRATFTFINDLNDFLPHSLRNTAFTLEFAPHQSLKHLVESLGIPHTDFGRIVVDGQEVESSTLLHDGEAATVYPAEYLLDANPGFVLDNHLGQLAIYLRMLGFDALYRNDYQDDELAETSAQQGRALLTRDRRLLMRKVVTIGYCLHHTDPLQQTVEVLGRFKLSDQITPFRRCLRCNSPLQGISKEEVIDRLEPLTKRYYDEFRICPNCKQIYWKGSHYDHMQGLISEIKVLLSPSSSGESEHK